MLIGLKYEGQRRRWAVTPYEPNSHQWWYCRIPRQVIVEEFLGDPGLGPPTDYKFFVVNQRVRAILAVSGRFSSIRRSLHAPDWTSLHHEFRYHDADDHDPRPAHLSEMIDIAEKLAADFTFIRVDLYDTKAGVRFGELTHCPQGGATDFSSSALGKRLAVGWFPGRSCL